MFTCVMDATSCDTVMFNDDVVDLLMMLSSKLHVCETMIRQ